MINVENTTNFIAWVLQIIVLPIIRTNLYIHLLFCCSTFSIFSPKKKKKRKRFIEFQKITVEKMKNSKIATNSTKKYLQNDVAKIDW